MTICHGLPRAIPEEVGMSAARLKRIAPVMQRHIDEGTISGALTMIAREGKLVHLKNSACATSPQRNRWNLILSSASTP